MNKQRFLAELQRLLVFMTEDDKNTVIRRYTEMFDEAGPEREGELLEKLGSPTKAAIAVSRGYEPGQIKNLPQPEGIKKMPGATEKKTADGWGQVPDFQLPSLDMPGMEAQEKPGKDSTAQPEPPAQREFRWPEAPEEQFAEDEYADGDEPVGERNLPLVIGLPLFILVFTAIGLPLAAVTLAVLAICLAPGIGGVGAAVLTAVGGLWCVSYMADAVMMFGAAFLVLAIGLLLLWCGIWADIKVGALYVRGMELVYTLLLGRKEQTDE